MSLIERHSNSHHHSYAHHSPTPSPLESDHLATFPSHSITECTPRKNFAPPSPLPNGRAIRIYDSPKSQSSNASSIPPPLHLRRRSPFSAYSSTQPRPLIYYCFDAILNYPRLGVVIGIFAALILCLLPFYAQVDVELLRSTRLNTFPRARHHFAHTALYGEKFHLQHDYPVVDAKTLMNSAAVKLTYSSRRAINVAYHKAGKALLIPSPSSSSSSPSSSLSSPNLDRLKPLYRWGHLFDNGVRERIDIPTLMGIEFHRDYASFPSPLPVFLSLPTTIGRDGRSPPTREQVDEGERNERVLCFYVFSATDDEYLSNLEHFVRRVILRKEKQHIDYVFIINQLDNKYLILNNLSKLPPNARYIQHRNECYDWGSIGWLLNIQDELQAHYSSSGEVPSSQYWLNLSQYKYFIIMNSSVRGPWFPSYVDLDDPRNVWYAPLRFKLERHPATKLVGPVVSCQVQTHLQSYILMTDRDGLETLRTERPIWRIAYTDHPPVQVTDYENLGRVREAARRNSRIQGLANQCADEPITAANIADLAGNGVFGCHSALEQAILEAELGSSKAILEAGYNLGSLTRFQSGIDFRVSSYQRCFNHLENPSDLPLEGGIIQHGPHSRDGIRLRRAEEARYAELRARRNEEKEYRDLVARAVTLAESSHKSKEMFAVSAAITNLLQVIPSTLPDGADEVASITGVDSWARRAQALIRPWNEERPMVPTIEQLQTRFQAAELNSIYLDPLEVLFGKYKTHIKFPPQHLPSYYHSRIAAERRLVRRYAVDYVRPLRRYWDDQFYFHRYRVAAREAQARAEDERLERARLAREREEDEQHRLELELAQARKQDGRPQLQAKEWKNVRFDDKPTQRSNNINHNIDNKRMPH